MLSMVLLFYSCALKLSTVNVNNIGIIFYNYAYYLNSKIEIKRLLFSLFDLLHIIIVKEDKSNKVP